MPGAPGAAPGSDARLSRAKDELEAARALDQRDDPACRDAVTRVRQAVQGGG